MNSMNSGACPVCLLLDEDATITLDSRYDKDGIIWERETIQRRCGHSQTMDYPIGYSLSAGQVKEGVQPMTSATSYSLCPRCGGVEHGTAACETRCPACRGAGGFNKFPQQQGEGTTTYRVLIWIPCSHCGGSGGK